MTDVLLVLLLMLMSCTIIVYVLGWLFELDQAFKFRIVLKNFDKVSYACRENNELYFYLRSKDVNIVKITLREKDIIIYDRTTTYNIDQQIILKPRFHVFLCRRLRKKLLSLVPIEDIPDTRKRDFTDYL